MNQTVPEKSRSLGKTIFFIQYLQWLSSIKAGASFPDIWDMFLAIEDLKR